MLQFISSEYHLLTPPPHFSQNNLHKTHGELGRCKFINDRMKGASISLEDLGFCLVQPDTTDQIKKEPFFLYKAISKNQTYAITLNNWHLSLIDIQYVFQDKQPQNNSTLIHFQQTDLIVLFCLILKGKNQQHGFCTYQKTMAIF